jgi:hypothetical protein
MGVSTAGLWFTVQYRLKKPSEDGGFKPTLLDLAFFGALSTFESFSPRPRGPSTPSHPLPRSAPYRSFRASWMFQYLTCDCYSSFNAGLNTPSSACDASLLTLLRTRSYFDTPHGLPPHCHSTTVSVAGFYGVWITRTARPVHRLLELLDSPAQAFAEPVVLGHLVFSFLFVLALPPVPALLALRSALPSTYLLTNVGLGS